MSVSITPTPSRNQRSTPCQIMAIMSSMYQRPRTRLKRQRLSKGLTAVQLAKILWITPPMVYKVEMGLRDPSFRLLLKWMEALECDVDLFR